MQFSNLLSVASFALGLLATGANGQYLERTCLGRGISCEYPKGRCAKLCDWKTATCSCPGGQEDNGLTGANCITALQVAGRSKCTD